ncbi:uncharacterized protein LOC106669011 [Cimex lectularius]|uniref:Uncharacterized protein n=1 Tax=Cimex lectularius TaxID=79782 RepID=A0A8I6RYP8_CIMLE|nr:uncharacterized protein LOC106669011 [Cimex lectularius]
MDKPRSSTSDESNKTIETEVRTARSSILKPQRPRTPFQDTTLGYINEEFDLTNRRRRVSFAGVNIVKEFCSKTESQHIGYIQAYEETFSLSSDSSHFTNSEPSAIPVRPYLNNLETSDDSILSEKSMDLTLNSLNDDLIQNCDQGGKIQNCLPNFDILSQNRFVMESDKENHLIPMVKNPNFLPNMMTYNFSGNMVDDKKVLDVSDTNMSMTNVLYRPDEFTDPRNKDLFNYSNIGDLSNNDMEMTEAIHVQIGNRFSEGDNIKNSSGMEFTEVLPTLRPRKSLAPQTLVTLPLCNDEEQFRIESDTEKLQSNQSACDKDLNTSLFQNQLDTSMEFTNVNNIRSFVNFHKNTECVNSQRTSDPVVIDMEITEQVNMKFIYERRDNLNQTHENSEMQFTEVISKTPLNESIGMELTEAVPHNFLNTPHQTQENQKPCLDVKETNPIFSEMSILGEVPPKQAFFSQKMSLLPNVLGVSQVETASQVETECNQEKLSQLIGLEPTEEEYKHLSSAHLSKKMVEKEDDFMDLTQNRLPASQEEESLSSDDKEQMSIKEGLNNKFDIYEDLGDTSSNNDLSFKQTEATNHRDKKREKGLGEILSRKSLAPDKLDDSMHANEDFSHKKTCIRSPATCERVISSFRLELDHSLELSSSKSSKLAGIANSEDLNKPDKNIPVVSGNYEMCDDNPLKGILEESVLPDFVPIKHRDSTKSQNNQQKENAAPKSNCPLFTVFQSPDKENGNEVECAPRKQPEAAHLEISDENPLKGILDESEHNSDKSPNRYSTYHSPQNEEAGSNLSADGSEIIQEKSELSTVKNKPRSKRFTHYYCDEENVQDKLNISDGSDNKLLPEQNSMLFNQDVSSENTDQVVENAHSMKFISNDTLLKGVLDDSESKSLEGSASEQEGSSKLSKKPLEITPYKNSIGELFAKRRSDMCKSFSSSNESKHFEKPEDTSQSTDRVLTCHPLQEVLQNSVIEPMELQQHSSSKKGIRHEVPVEEDIKSACESLHKTSLNDDMNVVNTINHSKSVHAKMNLLEKFNNSEQNNTQLEIHVPCTEEIVETELIQIDADVQEVEAHSVKQMPDLISHKEDVQSTADKFSPCPMVLNEEVDKQNCLEEIDVINDVQISDEAFEPRAVLTPFADTQKEYLSSTDSKKRNITLSSFMSGANTPYEKLSYFSVTALSTPGENFANNQRSGNDKTSDKAYAIRIKNRDFMASLGFKRITLSTWKYKICHHFYLVVETGLQEIFEFTSIKKIYYLRKLQMTDEILDFIEINFKISFPEIHLVNQCKNVGQLKQITFEINSFWKKLTPLVDALNYLSQRFPFTLVNRKLSFSIINLDAKIKFDVIINLSDWKQGIGERNVSICQGIGQVNEMAVKFLFDSNPFEEDIFFKYVTELKNHCGLLNRNLS